MNGKQYKKIRKIIRKSDILDAKKNKYSLLKMNLVSSVVVFKKTDNLITLEQVVKDGIKILKLEGYPIQYGKK